MKKISISKKFLLLAMLCAGVHANAAISTGTTTVTGTLEAPLLCSVSVPATIDFGIRGNGMYIEESFNLDVNCNRSTTYFITAEENVPVTIGPDTNYLSVLDDGNRIVIGSSGKPGSGSSTSYPLLMQLHGTTAVDSIIPVTSVGSFSKSVTLTVIY